jgi:F-type H+-transporting ATPase subunit gamma
MTQEPVIEQLLPLTSEGLAEFGAEAHAWDYIYEPDARS